MSIQFPANPPLNDTFDYDGKTYIWDGEKWTASAISSFDEAYVNVSGDTMTGDLTVPSLNGGPLAGFRNQIINGTGAVTQRGVDITAATDGDYTVDRWNVGGGVQVLKMTGLGALCPGFDNAIGFTATAGRNWIRQGVELGTTGFAGKFTGQWTLSVWATQPPSCALSFSDDASFTNVVQVVTNTTMTATGEPDRVNGVRTYTHYSHTFTISQTPDAANECLAVQLSFPVSSQTVFTGVQLEPGPVATPFEHRPIGTELALCQRYYRTGSVRFWGDVTSGQNYVAQDTFPEMRATPLGALVSTLGVAADRSQFPNHTTATIRDITSASIGAQNQATGAGVGRYWFGYTADAEL